MNAHLHGRELGFASNPNKNADIGNGRYRRHDPDCHNATMPFITLAFWLISQDATVQCDIVALWQSDIAGRGG